MVFIVYSKDGCPYCEKIIKVFETLKLEHEVYKLDRDFTVKQFCDSFGKGVLFPQVILNREKVL